MVSSVPTIILRVLTIRLVWSLNSMLNARMTPRRLGRSPTTIGLLYLSKMPITIRRIPAIKKRRLTLSKLGP